MAVVFTKSAPITNRDAIPSVLTNSRVQASDISESIGLVPVANGDSIASIFRMAEVPSNARVSDLHIKCGAITSAAADIGVYRNTRDGGAVVDADFFASAQSIASALAVWTDVLQESGVNTLALQQMPLWQALGFAADPNTTFDIAATLTAAATAGADLVLRVRYAD